MGDIDWVKWMALGAWVLWGMSRMKKIIRLWNEREPVGITVRNGEYKALVGAMDQLTSATTELVLGQKLIVGLVDGLDKRMSKVEVRLP